MKVRNLIVSGDMFHSRTYYFEGFKFAASELKLKDFLRLEKLELITTSELICVKKQKKTAEWQLKLRKD